jgi:hypothetical protein
MKPCPPWNERVYLVKISVFVIDRIFQRHAPFNFSVSPHVWIHIDLTAGGHSLYQKKKERERERERKNLVLGLSTSSSTVSRCDCIYSFSSLFFYILSWNCSPWLITDAQPMHLQPWGHIFFKRSQLGAHYFLVYLFQLPMCPSSGELTVSAAADPTAI